MTNPASPKISDNDGGEISATLFGYEIRGWSYKDDAERRISSVGKTGDLLEARGYLKAAIAKALEDEFNRGQRSAMAGDL